MNPKPEKKVSVRFYSTFKDALGAREARVSPGSVASALAELKEKFGAVFSSALFPNGRMNDRYIILLKGRRLFEKDLGATRLEGGDVLDIFPPVAGG